MNASHRDMWAGCFVTNFEQGQQHVEVMASVKFRVFSDLKVSACRSVLGSRGHHKPSEVVLGFLLSGVKPHTSETLCIYLITQRLLLLGALMNCDPSALLMAMNVLKRGLRKAWLLPHQSPRISWSFEIQIARDLGCEGIGNRICRARELFCFFKKVFGLKCLDWEKMWS